jgi:signal peptidase II
MSLAKKSLLVIFLILLADQILKIWVKTHMPLGSTEKVFGNWFLLRFIENPGMAFGIDLPGRLGKPMLTLFRIIAAVFIGWYLHSLIKKNAPAGFIICLSMIFAGAVGNIIDSVFYGVVFSESNYFEASVMFPGGGGYASLLNGRVVDMLYFPLIEGNYPDWFPVLHGQKFIFFRPIFNIADSAISVGVMAILLFQRGYLKKLK